MKQEELEKNLKVYIRQHLQELEFRLNGRPITLEEFIVHLMELHEAELINGNTHLFSGQAEIFIPEDAGKRNMFICYEGDVKIDEEGNVEINTPIIIRKK